MQFAALKSLLRFDYEIQERPEGSALRQPQAVLRPLDSGWALQFHGEVWPPKSKGMKHRPKHILKGGTESKSEEKNRRRDFLLRCKTVKWLVRCPGMKRCSTTLAGEGGSLRSNIHFLEPSESSTFPATELLGQFPASLGEKEPLCNVTSGKYGAGWTALLRESPSARLLPPLV